MPPPPPLPGAHLHLAPVVNPPAHFTWTTPELEQGWNVEADGEGAFTLEGVAYGIFLLETSAPGRRTHRRVVRVEPGRAPGPPPPPPPMRIELQERLEPQRTGVPWMPSLAAALDLAPRRKLPVFVFMTMDGEVANEYLAANIYRRPDVIELASHTIPVVTSVFRHSPEDRPGAICPKYGSVSCEDHIDAEAAAAELFLSPEASQVPQHVFLRPSGVKIEQRMYYLGYEALRNMIVRAIRTVNPPEALRVAEILYGDLIDPLRDGTPAERSAALADLLALADRYDEIARTALAAADVSTLSREEERAVLHRWLPGAEEDRTWFIIRLLDRGSGALREEAVRLLAAEGTDAARGILVAALGRVREGALARRIEGALGVERGREGIRLPGMDRAWKARVLVALAKRGDEGGGGGGDPAALPGLFELLADTAGDPEVRTDCALALLHYEARAVLPFLEQEVARGGEQRAILARVLGDLGDPACRRTLEGALQDSSLAMRIQAARALGLLGDDRAVGPLRWMLDQRDLDGSLQVAVASALVDLGQEEAGIPVLIRLADHPVYGDAAQAALREAYARKAPSMSTEWLQWWKERTGADRRGR